MSERIHTELRGTINTVTINTFKAAIASFSLLALSLPQLTFAQQGQFDKPANPFDVPLELKYPDLLPLSDPDSPLFEGQDWISIDYGRFNIGGPVAPDFTGALSIHPYAFGGTLSINPDGVNIGGAPRPENGPAALSIVAGDYTEAGVTAKIIVEGQRELPALAPTEMFKLVNNGGSGITLEDINLDTKWFLHSDNDGHLNFSQLGTGGSEFTISRRGGVRMGPAGMTNFLLKPNGNLRLRGTLFQTSDKAMKTDFENVDSSQILERVASMPITSWRFKFDDTEVRHIGPMSQDFHQAFGLGVDDKSIAPLDGIGVSLAAISSLYERSEADRQVIAKLSAQADKMQAIISAQQTLLASMSARMNDFSSTWKVGMLD